MTGAKGGKLLGPLSKAWLNGLEKVKIKPLNIFKMSVQPGLKASTIHHIWSSVLEQRSSAPQHLAAPRALQLCNQRELSYPNQDFIKGLTAGGGGSILQSDPAYPFNRKLHIRPKPCRLPSLSPAVSADEWSPGFDILSFFSKITEGRWV